MRPLFVRYNPTTFWKNYWEQTGVDEAQFIDLNMYPIYPTRKYLKPEDNVLECGFGAGRVLRHVYNLQLAKIVGLEYDFNACRKVHFIQPEIPKCQGSLVNLPFRSGVFDMVLCFGVLGLLKTQIDSGITEAIRVTRSRGILVLSLIVDNFARRMQSILSQLNRQDALHFYAWLDSKKGWEQYLESHGLKIIEANYVNTRYNLYQWTPFFRSTHPHNPARARINDQEYRLNCLGELLYRTLARFAPSSLAASVVLVCEKN